MIENKEKSLANSCDWSFPVPIIYGPGRLKELGRRTAEMALLNPLIVTDRGSAQLPFVSELQQILAEAGVSSGVFAEISPNPLGADVERARQCYREGEHDSVIAIGG